MRLSRLMWLHAPSMPAWLQVAWCKRNDVQCELVWDAGLMKKFNWAVDINEDFQFDAQPAYEA